MNPQEKKAVRHPNLSPTMDMVAKKIFHQERLTADFVRSVLKLPVKSVEILEGTQIQLEEYDHLGFYTAVDVRAQLDDGTQIIIEVQVTKQRAFINRLMAYIANQIASNLKRNKQDKATHTLYSEMNPVYCIAILEQDYFADGRAFRTISLRDDETGEPLLSDFKDSRSRPPMAFAFLELSKYNRDKVADYNLQKWFEFFRNQPFDIPTDPVIKEAEELLDQTRWTKEERQMFDEKRRQQDHYEATMAQIYYEHELAIQEEREKGLKLGVQQLVLAMLKNGASPQTIAQLTDIPEEKVKEIAERADMSQAEIG
ncbi:Rpn family recombination-promoting nuclease/putative transposase [Streptococcus panodentis]|uniref:Rpn family recombination-promoting nuclease/putative transposase n=1 Tax=Streptococcus panodentis TaxID=1581472 RepID=A0ABS5AUR7_9STRE|nr:Rpn family recombination-promoting nuclease/putative transposase [Streptococcus panodentis]MBP2620320.1 hypothetical protein [Streptococcus panodentis]